MIGTGGFPMTQDYIDVQNGKLFFTLSGNGEPIIFIHGNFNDHHIWDEQIAFFSPHYNTIQYDLRGYGLSSTPEHPFSYIEDLKTLIDVLQLTNITLVGSSMGGGIALDFALTYPHLVRSLVLVAPTISGAFYPLSISFHGIKNYINTSFKGNTKAIEAFINNPFWHYLLPSTKKETARKMVLANVQNINNFCRFPPKLITETKPSAIHRLHNIQVSTQIIIGDGDHAFNKKNATLLSNKLNLATKIEMTGCGHLPFVEEPQQFNSLVFNFLSQLS